MKANEYFTAPLNQYVDGVNAKIDIANKVMNPLIPLFILLGVILLILLVRYIIRRRKKKQEQRRKNLAAKKKKQQNKFP